MLKSCRETASSTLLFFIGGCNMRKHYFDENYFEKIDTEEKAYWLGFIAADGCVSKSSEYNSYRLTINLSYVDKNHLEKFKKCIGANDIAIEECINIKGFSNPNGTITVRLVLNSYKLCMDLAKYYIKPKKSYDIEIPNIDDNLMPHYLRGLFDGDGCYYLKKDLNGNCKRITFEMVGICKKFFLQIQNYLLSKEIKTSIYYRNNNSSIRLMASSRKEVVKIIDYLYSDSTIYLDRKLDKINEIKTIAA